MIVLLKKVNLEGCTLILPAVSVGNVGQLVVDLLIKNLKMEKFATLFNSSLIPALGPDPYNENPKSLATGCDFYYDPSGSKFVVVQLRSGIYNHLASKFLAEITEFVTEHCLAESIILTGTFSYQHRAVESSPFRYFANSMLMEQGGSKIQKLGWIPYGKDDKHPLHVVGDTMTLWSEITVDDSDIDEMSIDGGGFSVELLKMLTKAEVPTLLITKYLSEGDNIPDGLYMLNYLNEYACIFEKIDNKLVLPPSWNLLFGGQPPEGVY